MKKLVALSFAALCAVQLAGTASAVTVFGPGADVLAIDTDLVFPSSYPGGEAPINTTDQNIATKYLNFGKEGTGFIVTPGGGSSTIQSLVFTTGGDEPPRDPATYDLYGTNDAICSTDNGGGDCESWTLINSGNAGLDIDPGRQMDGTIQDFANGNAYTSYKMIIPTLRDAGLANSMQVTDVQLFTGAGGSGSTILGGFVSHPALAVTDNPAGSQSSYPDPNEAPGKAIDGDLGTKYLNFANTNSGLILTRADGRSTVVDSLTFTTGNDAPGRDPVKFDLYGTDEPIASTDNSLGDGESWTLITAGASTGLEDFFDMGDGNEMRGVTGTPQAVANTTDYSSYRIVFSELRGGDGEGIMQVGEVNFGGTIIPEPTSLLLALSGLVLCGLRRK
jgi:hypothetical protein